MDDRLQKQIADWLEFYRDLGIESFYRRASGIEAVRSAKSSAPRETNTEKKVAAKPAAEPLRTPELQPAPQAVPPATVAPFATRPQSLSLFETPPPVRRERETLEQIREDLGDCQRCRLAKGRKTIVFGQGDPHAELVFVGEGPGADEDEQGLPFVGRAGQLLNRMIQFVGMKRQDVYICNIVKCRPPGNRTPERDEIETCSPFLLRQIEAIRPRLVCCLGAPAMKTLLGIKEGITRVRGQFFDYGTTKAFVAYHPAYILRNPREEKILREDFEKIRDFLKT
jgi:uracil-DNA glycosylase family 4